MQNAKKIIVIPMNSSLFFNLLFFCLVTVRNSVDAWLNLRVSTGIKAVYKPSSIFSVSSKTLTTLNSVHKAAEISASPKAEARDVNKNFSSALDSLAGNVAICLYQSDLKRDDGFDGASTGWTSWVDDASAFRLQKCIDAIVFGLDENDNHKQQQRQERNSATVSTFRRDESIRYLRWIKSCPSPVRLEITPEFRKAVNATIPDEEFLKRIDSDRSAFLQRISCQLILLPSGSSLNNNLVAAPGSMIYGKLLYGGVTRYRMIGGSSSSSRRRRVGDRTEIESPDSASKGWLQYGGPERNYQAIDAGPCAFLELILLPKGLNSPSLLQNGAYHECQDMSIAQLKWNIQDMIKLRNDDEDYETEIVEDSLSITKKSGKLFVESLESSFVHSLGGLQPQIESIIRRVLDGRVLSSISSAQNGSLRDDDNSNDIDSIRRTEMETLLGLGLQPVNGLLLYGPPGCGKTALAREISRILNPEISPKIVTAPELLDRWVGGSEKLVRELFSDAELELRQYNGDATKSSLHVVVIDEIDAVFRKRASASEDSSGEIARASAVNQILAKLDGVQSLGNLILIGMTNRRELLDDALLRPGRLEVQIEIPLPDRDGRREIFQIHFDALRRKGRLSKALCDALDGPRKVAEQEGNFYTSLCKSLRPCSNEYRTSSSSSKKLVFRRINDLAANFWTGGFSGADIAGLVRCAGSIALARTREQGEDIDSLLITLKDVAQALDEVKK